MDGLFLFIWAILGIQVIPGLRVGLFFDERPEKLSFIKQSIIIFFIGPILWIGLAFWVAFRILRVVWEVIP